MDFPGSLRPALFLTGPLGLSDVPDLSFMCSWQDALTLPEAQPQNSENGALHVTKDLLWEPATPGPLPMLPPLIDPWDPGLTARDLLFRGGYRYRKRPRVVLDVTEQISRFLLDHGDVAFAPLGKLMLENFKLEGVGSRTKKKTVVSVKKLLQDLGGHQPWGCPWAYLSNRQRRFSILGGPILGTSVASHLAELLHEELVLRWEQLLLDEACTGGALAWVPGRTPQFGQLVYPAGGAQDRLHFQEVVLTPGDNPQFLGKPGRIQLQGPVRQVVTSTVQGESKALTYTFLPQWLTCYLTPDPFHPSSALLAVRSDYHCAVWKFGKQWQPTLLQAMQVEKGATGISLSPHLPGELAICSRSGAVCLWSPEDGLQQIYKDPETLVFRDSSSWRWADFTAHPRVLTVGDRTGVKMLDTQGPPGCGLLLFRLGAEASCQKGERVLLTQYLGHSSPKCLPPTLHLVCTQFSLYLVDERLPLVPMLKWNHGLPSPLLLARLLPPPRPSCVQPLLLGGQGGQLQLLHLAGEGASVPRLAGPPQSLPSRIDSLPAFPLLEPKIQWRLQERLKAPTIGLAAVVPPLPSAPTPGLVLFQLSAAGDVFYQQLRPQVDSSLRRDAGPPGDTHPDCHAPTASWTSQDTAGCSQWLKALLKVPLAPPVWTAPTFPHHQMLGSTELRREEEEGQRLGVLRKAMARGRLLLQRDLGSLPAAEPPPAPESGLEDKLSERLGEAWAGRGAAWWERQQGRTSEPGRQTRRPKRRTQLSSSFSLSGHVDPSEDTSPPHSPEWPPADALPLPPVTPPSQELTPDACAQGVPSEQRQMLRDYMAKLPPQRDTPGCATTPPHSQASSVRATRSQQHTPVLSSSQPLRKKPRMGF
ncbi:TATA box-binding protein-associated factor RNA polymerase I subunit C isoform X1 [Pan troglodytes]|uniref:TATA box-binding protein-associated factor RNA polymerase I subunit C isoform X1 n=3 Tax=Pan troglodytes TaxID=9598 RepID=UPI0023F29FBA|nr:TATA box-binding protein-associated factor RNA polymerase I subunit C isoform X1 [Pan troglodytes]XP_009429584.3 TATA box-binding protein-associated factor RNA polymerase I subunit C isoform X1 [Pan troglodytes]XP_009429585.3 TATA box-binding protein-associated factor RNA polymerase I subunit C isoform X1 [Pan troglodytes]XP_009429586.3 TATA box-binding protein-associated factor RNA polymerase I subunit C isoform X1 [Pan troglodytes]XP_016785754.2 TATA box-binding protein-associated factor R